MADAAARVRRETTWVSSALGPTIHVIVPSVRSPAMRSILGARAATRTEGGVSHVRAISPDTLKWSPAKSTLPVAISDWRIVRYSSIWLAGAWNDIPQRSSTTGRWETPTPSVSRPPAAAWAVSACCASAIGCRG